VVDWDDAQARLIERQRNHLIIRTGDTLRCTTCTRAAAAEAGRAQAAALDLPALTGTPKQIAWAEQIRAQALAMVAGLPEAERAAALAAFAAQTSASNWIDRRHTIAQMARAAAR